MKKNILYIILFLLLSLNAIQLFYKNQSSEGLVRDAVQNKERVVYDTTPVEPTEVKEDIALKNHEISLTTLFAIIAACGTIITIVYRVFEGEISEKKLRNNDYIKDLEKKINENIQRLEKSISTFQTGHKEKDNESKENIDAKIQESLQKLEELKKSYYELKSNFGKMEIQAKNDKESINALQENYKALGNKLDDLIKSILNMNMII